jgi:hypothetical protein
MMHTYCTPITLIEKGNDDTWIGSPKEVPLGNGNTRQVILSAAIQPDCEYDDVMLQISSIQDEEQQGASLPDDFTLPTQEQRNDATFRAAYDEKLKNHMIYHLTLDHKLPAKNDVEILDHAAAKKLIENLIADATPSSPKEIQHAMRGKAVTLGGHTISLEVFFSTYLQQIKNEFSVLEKTLPQGYVYTIDPPNIFAKAFLPDRNEAVELYNRLQALAFRALGAEQFPHLQTIAFNDYSDKNMVPLLQAIFGEKATTKGALFSNFRYTNGPKDKALVLHNNSDGFGQNIEHEGASSMDGMIGLGSNAYLALQRTRKDLCTYIV